MDHWLAMNPQHSYSPRHPPRLSDLFLLLLHLPSSAQSLSPLLQLWAVALSRHKTVNWCPFCLFQHFEYLSTISLHPLFMQRSWLFILLGFFCTWWFCLCFSCCCSFVVWGLNPGPHSRVLGKSSFTGTHPQLACFVLLVLLLGRIAFTNFLIPCQCFYFSVSRCTSCS